MARPPLTRILIAPVALSTVAAGLVLAPGMSAANADIAHRITSAKAQLATLQVQSEQAAESYDAGRISLAAANVTAGQMKAKAAASAARLAKAKQSVAAITTLAYSQGATGDTTLLYQAGDPAGFVDRAAMVDSMSRNDVTVLGSVRAAQEDAVTTQRAATQAVATARAIVAELAADKSRVQAAADAQTKVLGTLVAQQREMIRLAKIALAKAIAAKQAAAAAKARAEQAAAERAAAALELRRSRQQHAAAAFAKQKAEEAAAAESAAETAAATDNTAPSTDNTAPATNNTAPATGGSGSTGGSGGSGEGDSSAAATAVRWAERELGKPYVWGASGPNSFDCSGLTMFSYARAGVYLPHSSGAQYGSGRHVSRDQLRPGDLVFFGSPIHHVGIYIGNGDMIEAPEAGENVRVTGAMRRDYVGAVRPTG